MRGLPPGPSVSLSPRSGEQRSLIELSARLARNLLPLCGVQNPKGGDGRTRCLAFPELAVTTIRRGAPSHIPDASLVRGPDATIATGTISKYTPDILAAAVLSGANYAFDSIARANVGALQNPIFRELSPGMRLGIAAGLSFQAFREQPGLFAVAAQAARIQDIKVNGNLWDLPKTRVPRDPRYSIAPTTFNVLDVFKSTSWNLDLGPLPLADIFTENCLSAAKKPGATILPENVNQVVPKVIAHPGDFVRDFLRDVSQLPPEREWLADPVLPESSDYATLMGAWIANDISSGFSGDFEEVRPFKGANVQLRACMREVLAATPPTLE